MITAITHSSFSKFEEQYIALRQREGRICSDDELLHLPDVSPDHPHHAEWQARKESTDRLRNYLEKRKPPLSILEVGCGNGWLAHRLSCLHASDVTGTDVTHIELEQANRVFAHVPNLRFVFGGMDAEEIKDKTFDFIILASCVQYFQELNAIIPCCFKKLNAGGELHILDSPFYKPAETVAARQRTADYFKEIGFPGMAAYYFHHSLDALQSFHYEVLYQPTYLGRHLMNNKNPFPWIRITQSEMNT